MTVPSAKRMFDVHLMRPIFQRTIVSLKASTKTEAVRLALDASASIPSRDWKGQFQWGYYNVVAEHVVAANRARLPHGRVRQAGRNDDIRDLRYMLLRANTFEGEGKVLVPRWLTQQSDLMLLDLTRYWIDELQGIYANGLDGDLDGEVN